MSRVFFPILKLGQVPLHIASILFYIHPDICDVWRRGFWYERSSVFMKQDGKASS
jgi:hypothetical protein